MPPLTRGHHHWCLRLMYVYVAAALGCSRPSFRNLTPLDCEVRGYRPKARVSLLQQQLA